MNLPRLKFITAYECICGTDHKTYDKVVQCLQIRDNEKIFKVDRRLRFLDATEAYVNGATYSEIGKNITGTGKESVRRIVDQCFRMLSHPARHPQKRTTPNVYSETNRRYVARNKNKLLCAIDAMRKEIEAKK
jgi:hypothetical protein